MLTWNRHRKIRTNAKEQEKMNNFYNLFSQCYEPKQRIHMDLFRPQKTMSSHTNLILCVTDALSKYAELVAFPDKSILTVSSALFSR
jgi:hypothetical protein